MTCLETSTTDEQDQTTIDNQISRTTKGQPITADNTENPPSTIKDEKKKSVGKKRQIPTIIQKGRISRHRTTQNTKSVVGTEDVSESNP